MTTSIQYKDISSALLDHATIKVTVKERRDTNHVKLTFENAEGRRLRLAVGNVSQVLSAIAVSEKGVRPSQDPFFVERLKDAFASQLIGMNNEVDQEFSTIQICMAGNTVETINGMVDVANTVLGLPIDLILELADESWVENVERALLPFRRFLFDNGLEISATYRSKSNIAFHTEPSNFSMKFYLRLRVVSVVNRSPLRIKSGSSSEFEVFKGSYEASLPNLCDVGFSYDVCVGEIIDFANELVMLLRQPNTELMLGDSIFQPTTKMVAETNLVEVSRMIRCN